MRLITIFLNAVLMRSFTDYYAEKFELAKLSALLPFEFPNNCQILDAVRKYAACVGSERFRERDHFTITPIGLMAKRLEYTNTQSEFEGVYICRVYFGRDEFATLHIFSDGTWKEVLDVE